MGLSQVMGVDDTLVEFETGLFINNCFVDTKAKIEITNAATGKHIANLSAAQAKDVDLAVETARQAFKTKWRNVLPSERGRLLHQLANLIEARGDELASLEAVDVGVPFSESRFLHVNHAVETLRYFAGWADKLSGKLLPIQGGTAYTVREPIGVCAAIVPWNAPLMITCWKLAPAIAAGNTLVVKTPEYAPLYGQKLAQLIKEAGFPAGVVNIICGEGRIAGQALASHMDVHKIAFTGSTLTGRAIMKAAAESNLKKVTLELGGKSASIVFDDADFENAVLWTTLGITANNGQVCAAGSRIYVQSNIYERFLKAFTAKSRDTNQGDPLQRETTKGPMINEIQYKKVQAHIENAVKSGVKKLHGGDASDAHMTISNTAFFDVKESDAIMQEEIFGPVAAITKFDTEAEVIEKANGSSYGLSAAVFTKDLDRAQRLSEAIEAGQVVINAWGTLNVNTPFGGVKQSGFGRDLGEEALDGWTNTKTVKHIRQPAKL